jgi:hypothetical protein
MQKHGRWHKNCDEQGCDSWPIFHRYTTQRKNGAKNLVKNSVTNKPALDRDNLLINMVELELIPYSAPFLPPIGFSTRCKWTDVLLTA